MKEMVISILGIGIILAQAVAGTTPNAPANFLVAQPAPAVPQKLIIPALSVDTSVEPVGQDRDGRMGIPQNFLNAGWYDLGVRPGDKGNAVIDGHVNTPQLTANIFTNLDKLQTGDTIMVEDEQGRTWNFEVTEVTHFSSGNFPTELIFGPSDKPQLNLITCGGFFQKAKDDYSQRTVVFSQLTSVVN